MCIYLYLYTSISIYLSFFLSIYLSIYLDIEGAPGPAVVERERAGREEVEACLPERDRHHRLLAEEEPREGLVQRVARLRGAVMWSMRQECSQ